MVELSRSKKVKWGNWLIGRDGKYYVASLGEEEYRDKDASKVINYAIQRAKLENRK